MNNKPWNYIKIESKNVMETVDRNDDLPGYFGKVDLSLYYYDIQENKKEIPDKFKIGHLSQEQIYKKIITIFQIIKRK